MSVESIERIEKRYEEFAQSGDKVQALAKFMSSAYNAFYELAFTLSDEEKIRVMEFYHDYKNIVTNLICKLSNDELKLAAMRKFEIRDPFQLQVIVRTLSSYENQLTLINEFSLYDYCGDIINQNTNSNNKKL